MQELNELDLAIVNALQIQPRAPWALVGQALGVDAVTAARRWKRLTDSGAAWVDGYLVPTADGRVLAQVEIVTEAAQASRVAQLLAYDLQAMSVKQTSGARDILAIVWAYDLDGLVDYIGERIALCPGVRSTRSHVVTAAPFEGSRWRLRSLSADQRALLRPPERQPSPPSRCALSTGASSWPSARTAGCPSSSSPSARARASPPHAAV